MRNFLLKAFKSFWIVESFFVYCFFKVLYLNRMPYRYTGRIEKKVLFIFGSGSSLKDLSTKDYLNIQTYGHTLGFNAVLWLDKVQWDYFIIREFEHKNITIGSYKFESIFNVDALKEVGNRIMGSKCFSNAKYFICSDRKCGQSLLVSMLYGRSMSNKIFYTNKLNRKLSWPPSDSLRNIPHANATLNDAINIGYLLGYDELVLVGVDLYDSRYFYLNEDETRDFDKKRNRTHLMQHNTSTHILGTLSLWNDFLKSKNKSIKVLNPKSLASEFLEVYNF